MKYSIFICLVFLLMSIGCSTAPNQDTKKDSTATKEDSAENTKGGNLVKSEAPDAITKTEQGYALPCYEDGLAQSPINILSDSTTKDSTPDIQLKFKTGITFVENLGHTVQVDFDRSSITMASGRIYSARQFHFHTPSEHMIDGITYPMEMHIVNVLRDSGEKTKPRYLVVALLFKMGNENKFISEFLKAIPAEEKKDSLRERVAFDDLIKQISKNESPGYYTYNGSLTTPPYSETVNWVVWKRILEASPAQISTIEKLEGNNARHVQALYDRKVLSH